MKIEIAPKEYWLQYASYDEAQFYCFALDINGKSGWRLHKLYETATVKREANIKIYDEYWLYNHPEKDEKITRICIPVRDI